MRRRPPRSTRTDTLFPYTTLFRSDAQQVKIGGIAPEGVEQRHCVERRAIMMDLPFDPRIFAAIEKIPIAAGVAIIGPARDGRIIAQDHLARRFGLRREAEIAHPGLDFGLSDRKSVV